MGLGGGIDYVTDNPAGQLAAGNFQFVRGREVETEFDAQALGEIGETAGQDARAQAGLLAAFEQFAGARRKQQALAENAGQDAGVQSGEQGESAAQAFAVVDLTAHGGFGDRRNLGLLAGEVGQFVDAFDGDQRRIHVEADQPEIGQLAVGRGKSPVELLCFDQWDQGIELGRPGRALQADDLRWPGLNGGGAGGGDDAFEQKSRQCADLNDQVHGVLSGKYQKGT